MWLIDHVVKECAPNLSQLRLGFPLSLLTYLTVLIIEVEPVPLVASFCVSSHLIHLNLLFVIAAIQEVIEFILAAVHLEHPMFLAASLHRLTCLPALSSCNLVRFHLQSVL